MDNGPDLAAVYVDTKIPVREKALDLFGGVTGLSFHGKRISGKGWDSRELYGNHPVVFEDLKCKAVLYAYWDNPGRG